MTSLHAIPLTLNNGTETDFGRFSGKVVLVVNVASNCGFTPQYQGLESIQGVVLARFPPTAEPDSEEVLDAVERALG